MKCGIQSGGTLTNILRELSESGFISEYLPLNKKKKETLLRLTDEYSLFYQKFIKDRVGRSWLQVSQSRSYASWCGLAFETLCLKHVEQVKKGLGISGIFSYDASWRNENAQIDLLIDRDDRCVNICELKFSNTEFTIDKHYAENIRNKKQEFLKSSKTKKNVFITFITTYGVKANLHSNSIMDNQLKINCLFDK